MIICAMRSSRLMLDISESAQAAPSLRNGGSSGSVRVTSSWNPCTSGLMTENTMISSVSNMVRSSLFIIA